MFSIKSSMSLRLQSLNYSYIKVRGGEHHLSSLKNQCNISLPQIFNFWDAVSCVKMQLMRHSNAVALASLTFGATFMSALFRFYYVKIFLDHYHITQWWFDFAQVLYLIWNVVNDPLFAYIQDNSKFFRSRRHNVLYGGPFWVLSFLIVWFPWGDYKKHPWLAGMHLLTALASYDTMFTLIGLASCALYVEISQKYKDRLRLTRYNQIASILGSSSILIAEVFLDGVNNLQMCRRFAIAVALVSLCAITYCGLYVKTQYDCVDVPSKLESPESESEPMIQYEMKGNKQDSTEEQTLSPWTQFKQVCFVKDVFLFLIVNFLQSFHSTYIINFFVIFGDELLPESMAVVKKFVYGAALIVPQVLVLCLSNIVGKQGYYKIMLWSYGVKVTYAVLAFMVARHHPLFLAAFFIIEATVPNAIYRYGDLALSDIVDADQKRYNRRLPLSASVFSYNALAVKPPESLAPILIVAILDRNHYQDKLAGNMAPDQHSQLQASMFTVMCAMPFIVGLLQMIIWRPYSIRDSHITVPKHTEAET